MKYKAALTSNLSIAIVTFFFVACNHDPCGNEELQAVISPGGTRKAVVFQRDCGATTGFSTQISILPVNEKLPKEGGNTFIADTDHGQAPSGLGGGPEVNLEWANEREFVVKYDKRARVFRSEQLVDGVRIRYEPQ